MTSSQGHQDQKRSPSQPCDGNGKKSPTTTTTDPSDSAFDLSFLPIRKIFTLIFIHDLQHNQVPLYSNNMQATPTNKREMQFISNQLNIYPSKQLLLGKKQRGPLLGQWNGFGGKVEKGLETITESAVRELAEEAFLEAPLFPIGSIQWVVESNPESVVREAAYRDVMIVYKAHSLQASAPHPSLAPTSDSVQQLQQTPPQNSMTESTPQRITEFQASDEMAPGWWDIDGLPWEDMRINHKAWYPFMLADRPFRGVYWYETRTSVEEGALNAQRETVKEIWVEDLPRRCVQFGDRSLVGSGRSSEEGGEGGRLGVYARQLGLGGGCYLAEGHDHRGGKEEKEESAWPEPTVNKSLDDVWLRNDIAQAEQTWLNTCFP